MVEKRVADEVTEDASSVVCGGGNRPMPGHVVSRSLLRSQEDSGKAAASCPA